MTTEIRCPECASANVIFSKKRNLHVCEDCDCEFVPEKPFVAKRVFISYGHDEHASLAVRIRNDLRDRGHEVWFDAQRLQPGYDWEAFIEKGLEHLAADKANAALLLLLTPHSVRRPDGYCLNEVARALSLGLSIIPLMVVESEPPLSICRIQWLDMRECIPIQEKEAVYRPRFERLLKALEENQLDFEGTQQRLLKALQPLEFDADILHHLPKFIGRQWVFRAVEQWLKDPARQRVFWISGGPGVGKTAISAVLSSRYPEVAAMHLCKFGHAQKSDPRRVVTSVVYQLSTQLHNYEERLAAMDMERLAQDDAPTLFDNLLVQPLAKLDPPNRPIAILIDALDEATSNEHNDLAILIATEFPKTPKWLRLIITSRPEEAVTAPLQGLDPFILETDTETNRADLRDYLHRELAPQMQRSKDSDAIVDHIIARSEGVFLYAERVCDDVQKGNLSLDHLEEFPQGLGGVFWQFFQRQFPNLDEFTRKIRPALRAILATREPLPTKTLQRLFGWKDDELRDFSRSLGSLFPVTNEANQEVIKPYHGALADWLADKRKAQHYFVSIADGRACLADYCWREYRAGTSCMSSYCIRNIAGMLFETARLDSLLKLLHDADFIQTYSRTVGSDDALHIETRQYAVLCYASGDYTRAHDLLFCALKHGNEDSGVLCQVARVLLMLDRDEEAEYIISKASELSALAPPYIIPRIIWFQVALHLLRNARSNGVLSRDETVTRMVERMNTALQVEGAYMEWAMSPLLDHLQSRLPADAHALLSELVSLCRGSKGRPGRETPDTWNSLDCDLAVESTLSHSIRVRFFASARDCHLTASVDVHMPVGEIIPEVLSRLHLDTGEAKVYLLSYNGYLLAMDETLASAGIRDGATLDLVPWDVCLG